MILSGLRWRLFKVRCWRSVFAMRLRAQELPRLVQQAGRATLMVDGKP